MSDNHTHCACGKPAYGRGKCFNHYQVHRNRQIAYGRWEPQPLLPADEVRAHIEQIQAKGIRSRRLAQIAGIDPETLRRITRLPDAQVTPEIRDSILAVPVPERAADLVPDNALVPIHGARRRVQALVAFGYPRAELARQLGVATNSNAMNVLFGRRRDGGAQVGQSIMAKRDREVKELFDRLQLVPGPSDQARAHGRRKGWTLPFEWDEQALDDPNGRPIKARWNSQSAVEERREQVADLTARGWTVNQIAQQVGATDRTVLRDRARHREHAEPADAQRLSEIEAMGELVVQARRDIAARRAAPTVRERTR
ncbi:helix-turn-helix domain-containing protein [Nocardia nova]|uniref:helix-turn-helix domain-containing protein n=1 Tax=Nocardia nova TaxID=37330 RepID=UPI00371AF325